MSVKALNTFSILFVVWGIVACSSKTPLVTTSSKNSVAVATNTVLKPGPAKFYYADLQILTETSVDERCSEDVRVTEDLHLKPFVRLNEQDEIQLSEGMDFKYFATNVNLEVIGFDQSKYSFSSVDGIVPRSIPFGLRLRRTPGQILELRFLDQVIEMKLLTAPIYTFSATEKRGQCTVTHNVNVFTEKVGYFKKATAAVSP